LFSGSCVAGVMQCNCITNLFSELTTKYQYFTRIGRISDFWCA
jgi:hypothetical protein